MFEAFEKLPDDPILGLTTAFRRDTNVNKIDLGAGVYKNDKGITPVFQAVKRAEMIKLENETTKTYTGIEGDPVFCEKIPSLILGEEHPALREGRICVIATPGGSGALRVGAEVINSWQAGTRLWVSKPSWPNHIPLMATAGLTVQEYPYYDYQGHGLQGERMLEQISQLGKSDVLLIHACCHNPTGADLDTEQWQEITRLAQQNGFIPFIDFAYQGLGKGITEDTEAVRHLASAVPEVIIAYSCSKNFGLYRDRVGALIIITEQKAAAEATWSHLKQAARRLYSVPPAHGATVAGMILNNPELTQSWTDEVNAMCRRMNELRGMLADSLAEKGATRDFSFMKSQYGMFSMLGLGTEQVQRLREEYSVYMVNSSRINVAGISMENVDYLTDAIIAVL